MASKKNYVKEGLAFIAGSLLAFAFAPFSIYPLAVFCPALLLALWLNTTPVRAFFIGLFFGVGFFLTGVSWVFISIHVFGHTSTILSLIITALFIFTLATFIGLNGYVFNRFFPENTFIKRYLIFPSLWTLTEWIRSWILTGFPWLLLSTSQTKSPLAGYIPLIGGVGVSFLVTLSSALLMGLIYEKKKYLLCFLTALSLLWTLGYILIDASWTKISNKSLQVSLVQANIPQNIKWDTQYIQGTLNRYQQLTKTHWNSRLIIWPEAAIPMLQRDALPFLDHLDEYAKKHQTTLITGIPIQQEFRYYNGMLAIGVDHAHYYKQRLVIFGEYLPWWISWAKGLLNLLNIPMSSFSSGLPKQAAFKVAGLNLGTFICYEIAYPNLIRKVLPRSQLLLAINDDAWFGHSSALAQHLEIGQFQALATGRYLLFLSNTGMTAIITPRGQIQSQLPPFKEAVLTAKVYPTSGATPWVKLGDCPSIIFLVGLVILCYAYLKQKCYKQK